MGKLLAFPRIERAYSVSGRGCVCCWPMLDGRYEIGHESASGNSWGPFEQFDTPEAAIAAAYRLAQNQYDCEVHIASAVFAAVNPGQTPPPTDRRAF